MKTRKQKVISRILCMVVSILLLASFLVVPVFALDDMQIFEVENQIYDYGQMGPELNDDFKPYSSLKIVYGESFLDCMDDYYSDDMEYPTEVGHLTSKDMLFTFDLHNETALLSYFVDNLRWMSHDYTFSPSDTLIVQGGFLTMAFFSPDVVIDKMRFVLRNNSNPYDFTFDDVVAYTDEINVNISSNSIIVDYPDMLFHIKDTIYRENIALCIEFVCTSQSDSVQSLKIGLSNFTVKFGYSKSPNYPIYPSAPGGDQIDGLGSAEQELLDSSAAGLDEGISIMGNIGNWLGNARAGGIDLVMFTANFNSIMNSLIDIPGINALVMISLSLGLFGSLFGLAGSIISASSRGSGQAKRDADREARKK